MVIQLVASSSFTSAWTVLTGAMHILGFKASDTDPVRAFGHGQRLSNLTVNYNYQPTYTIGQRTMTVMPHGRLVVEWGVTAYLSELSLINLVPLSSNFAPPFFTILLWNGSQLVTVSDAFINDFTIRVNTDDGRAELDVSGMARSISIGSGTAPVITLPTGVFTFAGASLSIDGTQFNVREAEISITHNAEPVWRLGDSLFGAVALGELEATARLQLPVSNESYGKLAEYLQDNTYTRLDLLFSGLGSSSAVISLTGFAKQVDFRQPVTEIGVNYMTLTLRFSDFNLNYSTGL